MQKHIRVNVLVDAICSMVSPNIFVTDKERSVKSKRVNMCFQICCFSRIFPYLISLLMPIYLSFYGINIILRLSILLIIFNGVTSITSGVLVFPELLIQLALGVLLGVMPGGFPPDSVVWLYDKLLLLSEPMLQLVEVIGVVRLSMTVSQEATERAEEEENRQLAKGLLGFISASSYLFTGGLCYAILSSGSTFYISILVLVMVLSIVVHCVCVKHEFGVLSDAAVVTLSGTLLLYDIWNEGQERSNGITVPSAWTSLGSQQSFFYLLWGLSAAALGDASHAWAFLGQMCSPWFLILALARVVSVLYAISLLREYILSQEEDWRSDTEDLLGESSTDWKSPLLAKNTVVFLYTQFLVYHVYKTQIPAEHNAVTWLLSWVPSGRWIQLAFVNCYYLYRLSQRE